MAERKARQEKEQEKQPNRPLPGQEAAQAGPAGNDFSGVQVAPNGQSGQTASQQAFGANAYATGADVAFGAGENAAGAQGDRQLAAHELAHVVQQRGNRE